jgi:hypothetical protein
MKLNGSSVTVGGLPTAVWFKTFETPGAFQQGGTNITGLDMKMVTGEATPRLNLCGWTDTDSAGFNNVFAARLDPATGVIIWENAYKPPPEDIHLAKSKSVTTADNGDVYVYGDCDDSVAIWKFFSNGTVEENPLGPKKIPWIITQEGDIPLRAGTIKFLNGSYTGLFITGYTGYIEDPTGPNNLDRSKLVCFKLTTQSNLLWGVSMQLIDRTAGGADKRVGLAFCYSASSLSLNEATKTLSIAGGYNYREANAFWPLAISFKLPLYGSLTGEYPSVYPGTDFTWQYQPYQVANTEIMLMNGGHSMAVTPRTNYIRTATTTFPTPYLTTTVKITLNPV